MIKTLNKLSEINKSIISLRYDFLLVFLNLLNGEKSSFSYEKKSEMSQDLIEDITKIKNLFLDMSLFEQKEAIKIVYIAFLSDCFNDNPLYDCGFFNLKEKEDFIKEADKDICWKSGDSFVKEWFEASSSFLEHENKEWFNLNLNSKFYVVLLKTLISEENPYAKELVDDLPILNKKSFKLFFDSQPESFSLVRLSMSQAFYETEKRIIDHVSSIFISDKSVTETKIFYEQEILLFISKMKDKNYIDSFTKHIEVMAGLEETSFPSSIVKSFVMLSNYFYDDSMEFFNLVYEKMDTDKKLGSLITFLFNFEKNEDEDNRARYIAKTMLQKIFKNDAIENLLNEAVNVLDCENDKVKINVRCDNCYALFKVLEESENQKVTFIEDRLKKYEKGFFSSLEVTNKETTSYLNVYGWSFFLENSLNIYFKQLNDKNKILNVEINKSDKNCLSIFLSDLSSEEKYSLLSKNFKNIFTLACLNLNGLIYSNINDSDSKKVNIEVLKCLDESLTYVFEEMSMRKNINKLNDKTISKNNKGLRKF